MGSLVLLMVSILVLMDLCIKTNDEQAKSIDKFDVSILVLMDLCIKTNLKQLKKFQD